MQFHENPVNVQISDNNNNYQNNDEQQQNFQPMPLPEQPPIEYNHYNQPNEAVIEGELLKLRNNLMDQQNELLRQINDLKSDSQKQNIERYEALKEINTLKEELSKNRADEDVRKKYVYDIIVDNNSKVNDIFTSTKLPPLDEQSLKVDLSNPNSKKVNREFYEENMRHPNRVPQIPKLDEINDQNLRAESKFIGLDDYHVHNVSNISLKFRL